MSTAIQEIAAADPPRRLAHKRAHPLPAAFVELDSFSALVASRDRLLLTMAAERPSRRALIAAIESDPALVVAVLRLANPPGSKRRRRVLTIPHAVELVTPAAVEGLARRLTVVDFFEHVPGWGVTPDELRCHAVATQRVADQLAANEKPEARDELAVTALLHDVGKLVMGVAYAGYPAAGADRSPEERLRDERKSFGVDHATVGGVCIRRWGLPDKIAEVVAAHHDPEATGAAAILRLADMLVHYADGQRVDPGEIASAAAGMDVDVRELMQEVPGGDSHIRGVDPSPLSNRETKVLRGLANGRMYKQIAGDLGRSPSTIRSQVHTAYKKMGVDDRLQAILLATERGWL